MYKSILYVEDGSVDVEQLRDDLGEDIYVVIYRQGSKPPELVQPEKPLQSYLDGENARLSDKLTEVRKTLEEVSSMKMSKKLKNKLDNLYTNLFC